MGHATNRFTIALVLAVLAGVQGCAAQGYCSLSSPSVNNTGVVIQTICAYVNDCSVCAYGGKTFCSQSQADCCNGFAYDLATQHSNYYVMGCASAINGACYGAGGFTGVTCGCGANCVASCIGENQGVLQIGGICGAQCVSKSPYAVAECNAANNIVGYVAAVGVVNNSASPPAGSLGQPPPSPTPAPPTPTPTPALPTPAPNAASKIVIGIFIYWLILISTVYVI